MRTTITALAICGLLGLAAAATQAQAISRYQATALSCGDIHDAIAAEGAVILRWVQPPDIQRYDRYVLNSGYCSVHERARPASVPSATGACTVLVCRTCERDSFDPFRRCR